MVCTLQIYGIPFCNGFWDVQNKKKQKPNAPRPLLNNPLSKRWDFFFRTKPMVTEFINAAIGPKDRLQGNLRGPRQ